MTDTPTSATPRIEYGQLVAAYEASIERVLRGFHPEGAPEWLEGWVLDEDPLRSIVNLVDIAAESGLEGLILSLDVEHSRALEPGDPDSILEGAGLHSRRSEGAGMVLEFRFGRAADTRSDRAAPAPAPTRSVTPIEAPTADPSPSAEADLSAWGARLSQIADAGPEHRGRLDAREGSVRVSAEADGCGLTALVDPATHAVLAARYRGGDPHHGALLEALCRSLEGRPLLEGADHAVLRLVHGLRDHSAPRPVAGIVMPANVHPWFGTLEDLVRGLLRAYRREAGFADRDNSFVPSPATAWAERSDQQRVQDVQTLLGEVCAELDLPPAECLEVQPAGATRVGFAEVPTLRRSGRVLELERRLKQHLEPTLYVVLEELKDLNVIRRLAPPRTRREKR